MTAPVNKQNRDEKSPCHTLAKDNCAHAAVVVSAIPINADADRSNSAAITPSPDAEGRIRLRDPGIGIGEEGDPMFTMQSTKPHAVAIDLQNVAIGGDIAGTLDTTRPSRGGGQAVAVRTANTNANGHGVAEEVAHTVDQAQGHAIAFKPGQSEAAGGTFVTEEFAPTMQAQNNGSTAVPAVAFKPSHCTRGKDGAPSEVAAPLSADADKGDQDTVVAFAFAQNQLGEVRVNSDVMGTVNQNQNASGRNTPMVCGFSPLQGGRSMPVTPESPTLEAGTGNKTPAVAFANRTRDGLKVPEVMKDGVVPALTNPGQGGRADAVNIASAMQVRRLCPSECEALQGFPIGYTDVPYRKKPAADGPRYRALGNSMAVPCMWWLGKRIHEATQCD